MTFEELVASLNDEQLEALWDKLGEDVEPLPLLGDIHDAVELIMMHRGLI